MIFASVAAHGRSKRLQIHEPESTLSDNCCYSCDFLRNQATQLIHQYFPNLQQKDILEKLPESISIMMNENHRLKHDYQLIEKRLAEQLHHARANKIKLEECNSQLSSLREVLTTNQSLVERLSKEIEILKCSYQDKSAEQYLIDKVEAQVNIVDPASFDQLQEERDLMSWDEPLSDISFAGMEECYFGDRWLILPIQDSSFQNILISPEQNQNLRQEGTLQVSFNQTLIHRQSPSFRRSENHYKPKNQLCIKKTRSF